MFDEFLFWTVIYVVTGIVTARRCTRWQALEDQKEAHKELMRQHDNRYRDHMRELAWDLNSGYRANNKFTEPEPEMPPLEPDLWTFCGSFTVSPLIVVGWLLMHVFQTLGKAAEYSGDKLNNAAQSKPTVIMARPPREERKRIRRSQFEALEKRNKELERKLELVPNE